METAFYPARSGLAKFLGSLQAAVMDIIWANGPMTVKRALYFLNKDHDYAYTTVMTVMNRLVATGLLRRDKKGQSFEYTPTATKDEFIRSAVGRVVDGLLDDFGDLARACLGGDRPGPARKKKPSQKRRPKKS